MQKEYVSIRALRSMIEEIEFQLRCYCDSLENMIALLPIINNATELAGLLTVIHNDIKHLIMQIENHFKKTLD